MNSSSVSTLCYADTPWMKGMGGTLKVLPPHLVGYMQYWFIMDQEMVSLAYVDGTQIGTATDKTRGAFLPIGNGFMFIGKRFLGGGGKFATASVDEIKICNHRLTQQGICDIY